MDNVLEQFFTLPIIVFCMVIWVSVWLGRRILEVSFPKLMGKKIWNDIILPIWPLVNGAIFAAVFTKYPLPEVFSSLSGRVFAGIFCGMGSGIVYRMVKKLMEKESPQKLPIHEVEITIADDNEGILK